MIPGSLKPLEPLWSVQAFAGIPLPLSLNISMTSSEVESCYDLISTFLVHILLHSFYRSSVNTGESEMYSMPRA
jgi:hypothetical protein